MAAPWERHFAQAGIWARKSPFVWETQFYCNLENQKTAATLLICARREACASSNAGFGFPAVPVWGEPLRLRLSQVKFPRRVRTCERKEKSEECGLGTWLRIRCNGKGAKERAAHIDAGFGVPDPDGHLRYPCCDPPAVWGEGHPRDLIFTALPPADAKPLPLQHLSRVADLYHHIGRNRLRGGCGLCGGGFREHRM